MVLYFVEDSKCFKINGKLHTKIILSEENYRYHILPKHPDITIELIHIILVNPDYVYKATMRSPDYYYEKIINNNNFRVVIGKSEEKGSKNVITAYKINHLNEFCVKHTYCIYDRDFEMRMEEELEEKLNSDFEYFCEAFGTANE